ncbi:MAG: hypothetical protein KC547_19920 [Anaerolineae bacterium]|nr:hypothetical protein [Anaerolineae bacterium]
MKKQPWWGIALGLLPAVAVLGFDHNARSHPVALVVAVIMLLVYAADDPRVVPGLWHYKQPKKRDRGLFLYGNQSREAKTGSRRGSGINAVKEGGQEVLFFAPIMRCWCQDRSEMVVTPQRGTKSAQ